MPTTLPPLDVAAKSLSQALCEKIADEIATNGPMSFARYMDLALYAPGLGYYRNGCQKFGVGGDFVTAPELSPLFSYCIANHCAAVLTDLGGGDILEFGAGTGVMAAHILAALQQQDQLPAHYYILELSAELQTRQRETLEKIVPECISRVVWLDHLPEKPIDGVILANEVLDAMPVHQFMMQDGVKECGVVGDAEGFQACVLEAENTVLRDQIIRYGLDLPNGYCSEVNLQLPAWIQSVASTLASGVVLLVDYGFPRREYYHPDRSMGTIMCHYQHHSHPDPFAFPGVQDITAHVDFTHVAEAAVDAGLIVAGFCNQAAFLLDCGLLSFLSQDADDAERFQQQQACLRLTMPSEMGELFKVMALTKNYDAALLGFSQINWLNRL